MSPKYQELDNIIRQNVKDESAYRAISEMIAHERTPTPVHTQFLKKLHQLATTQYDNLESMFMAYLTVGCDLLNIKKGVVSRIENDTCYVQAKLPHSPNQPIDIALNQVMCRHVVAEQNTIAFHNKQLLEPLQETISHQSKQCYIGTPLMVDNQLWGILSFYSDQAKQQDFTDTEIEFVELMAYGIGSAIATYTSQQQQQLAEERYRIIFENINTPIITFEVDTYTIIDVNSAAIEFYGYSRDEFLELSVIEINMLPPGDIETRIIESQQEGRPFTRFPHRLKNGAIREVEAYTNDMMIDDRHIRFSFIYDYSEHHQAEEALKHSEANLRAIFDNTAQIMFFVDDTANIVAMNRAARQMIASTQGAKPKGEHTLHKFRLNLDGYIISDYIDRALRGETITYEAFLELDNHQPLYIVYQYVPVKTAEDDIIAVCVTGQDITSLKLSQQELSRERNVLRTLIDHLPDAIYIKDVEAHLLTANRRYLEIARVTSTDDILNKDDRDLYPQYGEQYYQDDKIVLQDGINISKDEPVLLPDDTNGIFSTTRVPLRDDQNQIVGLVGIGRDITQQRKIENALRRRDEILSTISEAAQSFLKDSHWRDGFEEVLEKIGKSLQIERVYLVQNVETSSGLASTFQYEWTAEGISKHSDYLNSSVARWNLPDRVEDLRNGELVYGHFKDGSAHEQTAMLTRGIRSMVLVPVMVGVNWWGVIGFEALTSDRNWHPVELDALKTAASTLGAAIQREKIEQGLRDNEEKFNQLITNIPETVWIYDVGSQQIIYASDTYEKVFGISLADRQKNLDLFLEQVHPDDRELVIDSLKRQSQGETADYEARFLDDEIGLRWVNLRIYPIFNEAGEPYRVAGIASDITDQKQAEQERIDTLAQKERINILSNFFRDASHEFKTPLSIINTSLYLLEKSNKPETHRQQMDMIHQQVRGISELVEALVLMSRLDSQSDLTLALLNVNRIVRQIDHSIQDLYPERVDDVHIDIDETLPPVMGHLKYVNHAIKNLVDNAVRYSSVGDPITIRTHHDGKYIHIEVEDNGIGISDDELTQIFKRFYRNDEAHSTRGFGLGLPIARRIARYHGGDVQVDTQLDQGSTFRLLLPVLDVLTE